MSDGTQSSEQSSEQSPQQAPQTAFDQAVSEYNAGNFERAKVLFQSISESGLSSSDLELNYSKALFKLGNAYQALQHAQAGVLLSRFDSGARSDLEAIQKSVPAGYGESMDHPVEFSWKIYSYIRPAEAGALSLFFFFLFFLGALFRRSLWTRASALIFSAGCLLLLCAFAGFPAKGIALVRDSGAELRAAPIASAETSLKLPPGSRIRIRQTRGDFLEIERPSGFRGWVKKDSVSRLL
jgi:hypothetical protein